MMAAGQSVSSSSSDACSRCCLCRECAETRTGGEQDPSNQEKLHPGGGALLARMGGVA